MRTASAGTHLQPLAFPQRPPHEATPSLHSPKAGLSTQQPTGATRASLPVLLPAARQAHRSQEAGRHLPYSCAPHAPIRPCTTVTTHFDSCRPAALAASPPRVGHWVGSLLLNAADERAAGPASPRTGVSLASDSRKLPSSEARSLSEGTAVQEYRHGHTVEQSIKAPPLAGGMCTTCELACLLIVNPGCCFGCCTGWAQ